MTDEVNPDVAQVPVTPAAPAENNAPAEDVKAPEAEQPKEAEEQHRSRQWRRLDRWRQRAIEAETRVKVLQESQGNQAAQQPKPERQSDEPTRDQFGTYEEFIEARAEYKAAKAAEKTLREAIRHEEQSRIKETQEKSAQEWTKRIDSARDEIEDFDEVCSDSEAPVTQHMSSAIMESDRGAHIAYYLAKHPSEAERISKLSPSKQIAAIVALEEKVAKPVKNPSKAPAPINPVNKGSGPDSDMPSDKDDIETWMKKERARMQKLGIR